MKKLFFTWLMMLASIISISAQSITSRDWAAETESKNGATVTIMTSFETNGSCIMFMYLEQEIERGTVMMAMIAPGSYTFDGKSLRMKINTAKADFYDDIDMKASNKKLADKMNHVMKQELAKEMPNMKSEFLGIASDYTNLEVKKLTSSEMVTTIGSFKGLDKGTIQKLCSE